MTRRKPRHRSDYLSEETEQVVSACLTVAVALGGLLEQLCIVGGLVPTLLIDRKGIEVGRDPHCGTNDLDVAMSIALFDGKQYREISDSLRQENFGPDTNEAGNKTPQRWRRKGQNVTIDFLLPGDTDGDAAGRVQPLEGDFGALISPELDVVFDEQQYIELDGLTLAGERVTREIPVCGPGAFVVLKAHAFADRGEPKDAYDLTYLLRHWPAGSQDIAKRISRLASNHQETVSAAIEALETDFSAPERIGPMRSAEFSATDPRSAENEATDARMALSTI